MNKVELIGRITRDIELKYTTGEKATAATRFSVAVNRTFKNASGEYEADFINCIAFGKTAEFLSKYFAKGSRIALIGRIQTGSYTKQDGTKVYTTDVVAEDVEFVDTKADRNNGQSSASTTTSATKQVAPHEELTETNDDDTLPF